MTEETSGRDWLADADTAAGLLRTARRLFVITGAGISADSGLPTYRGIGGLYDDTHTEDAIPIEQALSGSMLARRPAITWKYLAQIERACRGARHNRAHELLAAFDRHFEHVCVLTQNIDGFHRDAGSRHLIEMHGDVRRLLCTACDWRTRIADFDELPPGMPPACPACGEPVRPDVVLFGEMLPEAALSRYYRELDAGFDVVLSIGTTSVFPYIAGPVVAAVQAGIPSIEINPGETSVSRIVDVRIRTGAAAALTALAERIGI